MPLVRRVAVALSLSCAVSLMEPALLCLAIAIALLAGYTIGGALLCHHELSESLCFPHEVLPKALRRKSLGLI